MKSLWSRVTRHLWVIPFSVFLATGWMGRDFGAHWDEWVYFSSVRTSLYDGRLLPAAYLYPSVPFWTTYLAILPQILSQRHYCFQNYPQEFSTEVFDSAKQYQKPLILAPKGLESHESQLSVRTFFIFVTALAIIGVYYGILLLRGNWLQALLGSSLLAFSWEYAYHSRWITGDGLLVTAGSFGLLALLYALTRSRQKIWLGAALAGVLTGVKYPAGIFIVSVFVADFFFWADEKKNWRALLFQWAKHLGICLSVFIMTTPGAILDPFRFLSGIERARNVYISGTNYRPGSWCWQPSFPSHLWALFNYFSQETLSSFRLLAVVLFLLALLGVYSLFKSNRRIFFTIIAFPASYFLYFASVRLMVVRNVIVLIPFLAFFASEGARYLYGSAKSRSVRLVIAILISSAVIANGWWLYHSAQTIRKRHTDLFAKELLNYLQLHSNIRFFLTKSVGEQILALTRALPKNVSFSDPEKADRVVALNLELNVYDIDANRPDLFVTWIGSEDANLNYYPGWLQQKFVIFDRENMVKYHIQFAKASP